MAPWVTVDDDDELYRRYGHDDRYYTEGPQFDDPNLDWRSQYAGRLAWGIKHNAHGPRLLRQFLIGFGLILVLVVVAFGVFVVTS